MPDYSNAIPAELSEERWREWVRKGKLRDEAGARMRSKIAVVLIVVVVIGAVVFYLSLRR